MSAENAMTSAPENAAAEEAAWAEVLLAWDDEARHRAYLARFTDLDGLALAGRRYRDVLAARPGDPVASRFRDEVVKRAMVQGLVSVPRAAPPAERKRAIGWGLLAAGGLALMAGIWWYVDRLRVLVGAAP